MAKNMKPRKDPVINKEYVWELEVAGRKRIYKVFVGQDECITYEDGMECKHLKIMDKTQQLGVLQIDCKTRVFDEIVPFKLEYGIPYIKIETDDGKIEWVASDTTMNDRLQRKIRQVKKESYIEFGLCLLLALVCVVQYAVNGTLGQVPIAPIMAGMAFIAGFANMINLKTELDSMNMTFSFKLVDSVKKSKAIED